MGWVVGGIVFEHAEGDFEELVKDGDDDGEFGFSGGDEAVREGFESRVVPTRGESGHVEGAPEADIAIGAGAGGGMDRRAGLMDFGCDTEPGGRGACIEEMTREFRAKPASGAHAHAFDLAEALDFVGQGRRCFEMRSDLLLEESQLLLQGGKNPLDAFGHRWIGERFQAIAFGVEGLFQLAMPAQQGAQVRLVCGRWHPNGESARGAEVRDERSVEAIGLVPASQAASVIFNAAGIGEVDRMSGCMKFCGGEIAVTTCGFKNDAS